MMMICEQAHNCARSEKECPHKKPHTESCTAHNDCYAPCDAVGGREGAACIRQEAYSRKTLIIHGVDLKLLEEQRKALIPLVTDYNLVAKVGEGPAAAILGIQNMLDQWSDKREGY